MITAWFTGPFQIKITNSEFKNNSAADYGGAISYEGSRDCEVQYQGDFYTGNPYSDDSSTSEPCIPSITVVFQITISSFEILFLKAIHRTEGLPFRQQKELNYQQNWLAFPTRKYSSRKYFVYK